MGRGSTSGKMVRLDQLLGRLKSGDPFTATILAQELDISLRTLMRDLQSLKEQGYPIETEKGRGGGVRLYPRWGIGRLALNYREVIDLLLALSVLENMDSPLLLGNLSSVRNKLFASFPDAMRPTIRQLRERILVGEQASAQVLDGYQNEFQRESSSVILQSFFETKQIEIEYQRADRVISTRSIEIHYLFLNWPVWYLISWDHFRDAPRTFRIDRVQKATIHHENFKLRALTSFSDELSQFSKPL
jgi:predicted DNA-binding transcriptional regulator YafY